ncbi:MAG: type II secretion system major pseudopilin GspG [Phycisphaerae bacterium]|nr:type II secretion system major pseudopilin GspG [Phycisphaerae bacterium]
MTKIVHKRNAFTLVEILVVVIIVAMLAAFLVPQVAKKLGKAKSNLAKAGISALETGLQEYYTDMGHFPTEEEGGLQALIRSPEQETEDNEGTGSWDGEYIKPSKLLDPWGHPYIYNPEGEINVGSYDIICFGADGEPGGDGENKDLFNDE